MRNIIAIAAFLMLAACAPLGVARINASFDKCAQHGGLKEVNMGGESAVCNDNAIVVTGKPVVAYVPGSGGL